MLTTESSGTMKISPPASAREATAAAERAAGGMLRSGAARGSSFGDRSMAVSSKGNTFSLDASRMPSASSSSASLRRGFEVVRVNPALSNLLSKPN